MNLTQVVVGLLAVGVVVLLIPPETKASLGDFWRRTSGDGAQACFDYERLQLNDSLTAKLLSEVKRPERPDEVEITFAAKNPFGTYLNATATCSIKSGKVDVAATTALRNRGRLEATIKQTNQKMDDAIKCLENEIARRKAKLDVSNIHCQVE